MTPDEQFDADGRKQLRIAMYAVLTFIFFSALWFLTVGI